METTQRHNHEEEESQIPRTEFERSSEVESDKKVAEGSTTKRDTQVTSKKIPNLTREEKKVRDGYFYCCENFFSLPEMINYMKVNHGLSKTTVTNVFRELLTGRNAEAYLRVSQRRSLERSSNGSSVSVGSSSSTK